MAVDFAIISSLVRSGRPRIRFLSIGPQLCSALPSDPASRRRPCASLILRHHQAGWRTFTSKLSIMLGTLKKPRLSGAKCLTRDVRPEKADRVQFGNTAKRSSESLKDRLLSITLLPVNSPQPAHSASVLIRRGGASRATSASAKSLLIKLPCRHSTLQNGSCRAEFCEQPRHDFTMKTEIGFYLLTYQRDALALAGKVVA
jgi:hypothetical protein